MTPAEEFRHWVLDPARTNDELFTAELLLETAKQRWEIKHNQFEGYNWEAIAARRRERAGNPAYRPRITAELVDQAIEVWDEIMQLWADHSQDRMVRDLTVLRFFPQIIQARIGEAVIADLSPLAALPSLNSLRLAEPALRASRGTGDLSVLGELHQLETLSLQICRPWPDLQPLGKLPNLRTLRYHGNPLALRDIGSLPGARVVVFNRDFRWMTPLRSLHELPDLPAVEELTVESVDDLAGIERFPKLRNLNLIGTYASLAPLATLPEVTSVRLEGEHFEDLSPLARMPALRELLLVREEPLDLDPLTDAPRLSEVRIERCAILNTELAALNAALTPWEETFLLPEPRVLPPLRFISYEPQHPEIKEFHEIHPEGGEDPENAELRTDTALRKAYTRWFEAEVSRRLTALLGGGWADKEIPGYLRFRRYRDVVRLREIVQTLRELLVSCRYSARLMLTFEPHGDMAEDLAQTAARQDAEDRDWLDKNYDPERVLRDHEEFRQRRREGYERRSREHRLRLKQQQGLPIDPKEFSTLPEPPEPEAPAGDMVVEENEGGIAEPPPTGMESSDFVEDLSFIVNLRPDILWVAEHMRENAEYHWGEPAEDWHALPGPLAERPMPH